MVENLTVTVKYRDCLEGKINTWTNSCYKMKTKKYHLDGKIPKSNIKIAERGKIDTPSTQINDSSRSGLGTGTSI